jgi:hypothetical protein
VLHNYVDFTVTANQLATTETGAIFDIPANTLVLYVTMRVTTGDADIETVDIGIEGGTTDGFVNDADIAAAGWFFDVNEGYSIAAAAPFISTSNAVVIVTNADAATLNEAKIHFYALCVDLTDASTTMNA